MWLAPFWFPPLMLRWRDVPPYALLWLVVALQVAIPASYYLRDSDLDDESFAWRMFSNVRLRRCEVTASIQSADGSVRTTPLRGHLHSSWIHSIERGRGRVVERFLASRCEAGVAETQLLRRCRGVGQETPSAQRYTFDCKQETLRLIPLGVEAP